MKKYFAKYLPVEGEMRRGDKITFKGTLLEAPIYHAQIKMLKDQGAKKAKLFLCSRDIQMGDKFHSYIINDDDEKVYGIYTCKSNMGPQKYQHLITCEEINESHFFEISTCFKTIGEISPEANWVKEGDEFDENELKKEVYFVDSRGGSGCKICEKVDQVVSIGGIAGIANYIIASIDKTIIYILGPCKHFH